MKHVIINYYLPLLKNYNLYDKNLGENANGPIININNTLESQFDKKININGLNIVKNCSFNLIFDESIFLNIFKIYYSINFFEFQSLIEYT